MSLIRVESFTVSTDGYGAGRDQSRDAPMGVNAQGLHGWAFATRTFRAMFGQEGGATGTDDRIANSSTAAPWCSIDATPRVSSPKSTFSVKAMKSSAPARS